MMVIDEPLSDPHRRATVPLIMVVGIVVLAAIPLVAGAVSTFVGLSQIWYVDTRTPAEGTSHLLWLVAAALLGVVVPLWLLILDIRRSRRFPLPFALWLLLAIGVICGPVYFDFLSGTHWFSPDWTFFNIIAAVGLGGSALFLFRLVRIRDVFVN